MKKRTISLILVLATILTLFLFAACDKTGDKNGETPSGSIQSGDNSGGNDLPSGGNTTGDPSGSNQGGSSGNNSDPSGNEEEKIDYSKAFVTEDNDTKITSVTEYGKTLSKLVIPDTITSIDEGAFYGCSSLTSIVVPSSVTSIGNGAFYNCPIEEATIPTIAIDYIPKSNLKKVVITSGESIGEEAFSGCTSLTSIEIPSSVTSIDSYAFYNCTSITSIDIPSSVTSIGERVFYMCASLTIYSEVSSEPSGWDSEWNYGDCPVVWDCKNNDIADDGNIYYVADNGIRYALKDGAATVAWQSISLSGDIVIASSIAYKGNTYTVTNISWYAFDGCIFLTRVRFGADSQLESIDEYAFNGCSSLTSIEIPSSVTSIDRDAFKNCPIKEATIPTIAIDYIPQTNLKEVVITSGESIGEEAFQNCDSLTSIEIYSCVTSIGRSAFYDCSSLTIIEIPSSVTSIGSHAFYGCSSLTIYCEAASKPSGWDSNWNYGKYPVVWDSNNNEIAEDGKIYYIADNGIRYALNDGKATVVRQLKTLSGDIVIPSNVTYKGVTYNVTSIGYEAFRNCSSLTRIELPSGVTSIGSDAFSSCSKLTSIVIPSSVTSIGGWAFQNCTSLTIYCEISESSKPSGWDSRWNSSDRPVVWGYIG